MSKRFNFTKKGGRKYLKWGLWNEGDYLVGKFIATYLDQYGNECYEVQIIEAEIEGIELKEGDTFGINSCGGLKKNMVDVLPGSFIQVTYNGEGEMEKGPFKGKPFTDISLEVDASGADEAASIKAVQDEAQAEEEDADL